jgi:diguanylate cyclase (GGDEF)-like protein
MAEANEQGQEVRPPAARERRDDVLAPLVDALATPPAASRAEVEQRLRGALPSAIAALVESNRRLIESAQRRDALASLSAAELRRAAELLERVGGDEAAGQARRLRALVRQLEQPTATDETPIPTPAPRASGAHPRLVVADDEEDARDVLQQVLAPEYEVLSARDGQEAIEAARAVIPDVVLLDLNMPRMDGFEALERLRADPATAEIPVIFVSARSDDAVKVRSLALGAVDYLQKPFSERELRARIERTLRLARSQTALREAAQTDPLTGLSNRRAFRARLEVEVKRALRYRTPLTCVMVDMDQLKPINDALGHAAGDRAIAAVAAILREELRETDFGARYGGDEFVILLPHTHAEEGRVFAERACARLHAQALEFGGRRVPLGASFGVACLPADAGDDAADQLVRAADEALYAAKRAGRGRVVLGE